MDLPVIQYNYRGRVCGSTQGPLRRARAAARLTVGDGAQNRRFLVPSTTRRGMLGNNACVLVLDTSKEAAGDEFMKQYDQSFCIDWSPLYDTLDE